MRNKIFLLIITVFVMFSCQEESNVMLEFEQEKEIKAIQMDNSEDPPSLWNIVYFTKEMNLDVTYFGTGPSMPVNKQSGQDCVYHAIRNAILTHDPGLITRLRNNNKTIGEFLDECERYWLEIHQKKDTGNYTDENWYNRLRNGNISINWVHCYYERIFINRLVRATNDSGEFSKDFLEEQLKSKRPIFIGTRKRIADGTSHAVLITGKINSGKYKDCLIIMDSEYTMPIIVHPGTLRATHIAIITRMKKDLVDPDLRYIY